MKKIITLLILVLLSSASFAEPEIKGSPQDLRGFLHPAEKIVTITGQAEEKAYSDQAIVSLVITTESKFLSEAIAENGSFRKKITDSLVFAGIKPDSIKSSKFSSSPQYGWFGSKPSSYKVINRMAVKITNEAHLQELAGVADQFEEVELSDTAFEHSEKDEYNERVKAEALRKVIKQKEFYEQSLGVKLTPVGIRDTAIRQGATRGAMMLEEVVVTGIRKGGGDSSSVARYKSQTQEPSFDEVKYEANISVDFKIGD